MTLTEEDDKALRGYARRLHRSLGEEAYYNVVCDMLLRGKWKIIHDVRGFFVVSMKYALIKIFRHEASERRNIEAYINNDPIPTQIGLWAGRQKHETCRKGLHPLVEGNLVYIGVRRTCRACKQARERVKA